MRESRGAHVQDVGRWLCGRSVGKLWFGRLLVGDKCAGVRKLMEGRIDCYDDDVLLLYIHNTLLVFWLA